MPELLERRQTAKAGIPLSEAGGLPPRRSEIVAASSSLAPAPVQIMPSLASALRPQATNQWMLPYLASLTPQYIEMLLKGMLYGSHVAGMELFTVMIDTDPEIAACVQEYTDGVMDKKFQYEPYHDEDEEPSDEAIEKCKVVSAAMRNMRPDMTRDENDLRNTVKDIIFARFHGMSVLEVDWNNTYGDGSRYIKDVPGIGQVQCVRSTYWVHPVCYALDTEYRLGLNADLVAKARKATQSANSIKLGIFGETSANPVKSAVVEFPPDKFLIGVHKAKTGSMLSGSCLRSLAWWWIASNFCGDWLLKYAELFGIPFRWAKLDSTAWTQQRTEIGNALQNMGNNGFLMTPVGVELEWLDSKAAAGQSPQAFLFEFADRQKRKVILHQTMSGGSGTTGKGGGQAFGVVEDDVKSDCIDAGARFAESVINLQLVPAILNLNYGDGGDLEAPTVKLIDVEVGNLADAQRDQILTSVMDVPDSYFHRRYGIPKPKAGDKIAGQDVGSVAAAAQQAADQHDAQMAQQAESAKAMAKAAAQQPQNGGHPGTMPGGQQNQKLVKEPQDKGTGTQARSAIEAGAESSKAGCLMAMLPGLDGGLPLWTGDNIAASTLTADGIEQEPHVTVLYGFELGFDIKEAEPIIKRFSPVELTLGKVARFECPEYDVLYVEVDSPELVGLNKAIASRFDGAITFSKWVSGEGYKPHLTLAYVEKGTNKDLDGAARWDGMKLTVRQFLYSEPDKTNCSVIEAKDSGAKPKVEAQVLHATIEPMLARLQAIEKVDDAETRKGLLQKFLKDHHAITAAMMHDESLANQLSAEGVAKFLEGLKSKPKEAK